MKDQMLEGWTAPDSPESYPDLTAVRMQRDYGHSWHLDFSRCVDGERFFAGDADKCPVIAWPWVKNFEPDEHAWRQIGFAVVVTIRDTGSEIRPLSALGVEIRAMVESMLSGGGETKH